MITVLSPAVFLDHSILAHNPHDANIVSQLTILALNATNTCVRICYRDFASHIQSSLYLLASLWLYILRHVLKTQIVIG
jgi:hypothetical protein